MIDHVQQAIAALQNHDTEKLREVSRIEDIVQILSGRSNHKKPIYCGVGRAMLAVAADGKIYPCHRFVGMEAYCLGSVNNEGPTSRLRFESHGLLEIPACRSCFARFACHGYCAYDNLAFTGDLLHPPPDLCEKTKIRVYLTIYFDSFLKKGDREYLEESGMIQKGSCGLDFLGIL